MSVTIKLPQILTLSLLLSMIFANKEFFKAAEPMATAILIEIRDFIIIKIN